jgi:predicted lipoprotein
MKLSTIIYGLAGCAIFITTIVSCSKDGGDAKPDFDRTALVVNIGNNIIIPNYQALSVSVTSLDASIIAFDAEPNETTLEDAQAKFKDAYKAWQRCAPFGFGPADQILLSKNVNIFPTNVDKINTNISGEYNLDQLSNLDAKGFAAIDYMLFGVGADNAAILSLYTSDDNADKRKQYLAALSANIKSECATVLNAWLSSDGNYINTFLTATGTDVGSAIGQIINGVAYDLDVLKNYKVAIPVGIMPSSGTSTGEPLPQKVEGYYSGISAALLLVELTTLQDIYLGRSSQQDSVGIDDYIIQNKVQYNGGSLNDAIKAQFITTLKKLNAVADPLSTTISSNPDAVEALYTELQKLLVLLKTDMPSSLGILITYEDTDGD